MPSGHQSKDTKRKAIILQKDKHKNILVGLMTDLGLRSIEVVALTDEKKMAF